MVKAYWNSRTKHDLIIEVWEALDCESVGTRELERIQQALHEKFGEGAVASPAAIARTVADEGAQLRHPEVFECDVDWRAKNLKKRTFKDELDFSDLSLAFASVVKIEEQRLQLQADSEENGLRELHEIVLAARKDLLLQARSKIIERDVLEQLQEAAQWLRVWLLSPELFSDWLDLRRRSPEFRKRFQNRER